MEIPLKYIRKSRPRKHHAGDGVKPLRILHTGSDGAAEDAKNFAKVAKEYFLLFKKYEYRYELTIDNSCYHAIFFDEAGSEIMSQVENIMLIAMRMHYRNGGRVTDRTKLPTRFTDAEGVNA